MSRSRAAPDRCEGRVEGPHPLLGGAIIRDTQEKYGPAVTHAPDLPSPATASMVRDWLASDEFVDKLKGLAAIIHPEFPVQDAAAQVRQLATSVSHQARHFAAIAMGNGGATFADDLSLLVGGQQKTIVRVAAAHALFRMKCCPASALAGLAGMLTLDHESARRIAAAVLEEGPPERFGAITGAVRELPPDKLNLEALSALADAAKGQTGAADRVARWLGEIAESQPPIDVRMAILAALARMTDGARGANGLMQIVEEGSDTEQRKAAIATLGSLGEHAASYRSRILQLLVSVTDEECEAALYRLLVQIRTPPKALPLPFLLQRIAESANPSVVAGACMLLTLGGKAFAEHARVVAERYEKAEGPMKGALAICYEKLTDRPIDMPSQATQGKAR